MTAAGLAALAAGDEENRIVPIGGICDETHGRAVPRRGGARAKTRAGLRLVGDAQEKFEQAGAADRMLHLQGVEIFPLPIVDARAAGSRFERVNGGVGRRDEEFVVTFKGRRKPFRRPIGEEFLEESVFAPAVEIGVFGEIGFEDQAKRFLAREGEEGNYGRVGDGDAGPIFCGGDQLPGAVVFGRDGAGCGDELFRDEGIGKTVSVRLDLEHVGWAEVVLVME